MSDKPYEEEVNEQSQEQQQQWNKTNAEQSDWKSVNMAK